MKFAVLFLVITFIAITFADELTDCKCWQGYEPVKNKDGVGCTGILLQHKMPCNEPEPPKCVCSGNVTGILIDSERTWCSEYTQGKPQKKWACENKEEWEKFYKEYPKEKP